MFKLSHKLIAAACLFILCLAAYHNVFHNEFFLDDQFLIAQHGNTFSQLSFKEYFKAYPGGLHVRPVGTFLIAKLYLLFQTNVIFYHIFNLLVFYVLCLCVLFLTYGLSRNLRLSIVVAVLFCVHPINAVFVNFITTHIFTILGILGILSVFSLFHALSKEKLHKFWYVLSIVFFSLAFLCHPIALAIFLVLCAMVLVCRNINLARATVILSPYGFISAAYVIFRILNGGRGSYVRGMSVWDSGISFGAYWNAILDLFSWYVLKIFYPVDIVFINNIMTPEVSFLWLKVVVFIIFTAGIFILSKESKLKIFSLIWFLSGFVVAIWATQIYYYLGVSVEILWFVFSSVGLFLFSGLLLEDLFQRYGFKIYYSVVCLIVGVCLFQTVGLNKKWKSEKEYFSYLTDIAPNNVLAWKNLGDAYLEDNQRMQALEAYQKALAVTWAYKSPEIFGRVGHIYEWDNDLLEASQNYYKAIISDPICKSCSVGYQLNYESAMYKLVRQDNQSDLEKRFTTDYILDPNNYFYIWNLASFYLFNGQLDQAVQLLESVQENVQEPIIRKIFLSKIAAVYYFKGYEDNAKLYIQMMLEGRNNRRNMDILNVAFLQRGFNPKKDELQVFFSEALSSGK